VGETHRWRHREPLRLAQGKYGLSWQIIPKTLGQMLQDKDPKKAQRVLQAMLQMRKIDIAGLKRAYDQG
jgi:predicted 3-demethylubiquinone-9 3-methyltransferase (glyoxalase superfamily)